MQSCVCCTYSLSRVSGAKKWARGLLVRKGYAELYEEIKELPRPLRYIGIDGRIQR
jgi:hypothetical protein